MPDTSRGSKQLSVLPSGIQTSLPEEERAAGYDKIARGYDALVGNALYNHIVWGCPKSAYAAAVERFFDACPSGPVIDFGCGSLVFTADAYRGREDRLTLFDRSLGMLERGQARLPQGKFVQGTPLTHLSTRAHSWARRVGGCFTFSEPARPIWLACAI